MAMIQLSVEEQNFLQSALEELLKDEGLDKASLALVKDLQDKLKQPTVPKDIITKLERFLDLGLSTGRFRIRHGKEGEMVAFEILKKTPLGQQAEETLGDTNKALKELQGEVINEIVCSSPKYGVHQIKFETSKYYLTVEVDKFAVRVVNVEVQF